MNTKKENTKKVAKKISVKRNAPKAEIKKVAKKSTVSKAVAKKVPTRKKIQTTKALPAIKKNIQAKKADRRKIFGIKRSFYMTCSVLLGLLIGIFVYFFMELVYMKNMVASSQAMKMNYFLAMPTYLPGFAGPLALISGLLFGLWLGNWGWKHVYIDRKHRATRLA